MKRRFYVYIVLLVVTLFSSNVQACEIDAPMYIEKESSAQLRADVIEKKYRTYNGRVQYRRWNATRGFWVDKDWIFM